MDSNPDRIRSDICDYLQKNPNLFDDELSLETLTELEGIKKEDYVSNMRNSQTWGGAIEIKAFCNLYTIDVEVYVVNSGKHILFKSNKPHTNGLIKIYWTGNHYEPVL